MKLKKIASVVLPILTMFFIYSCGDKGNSHKDPEVVAKIDKELIKKQEVDDYYGGLAAGFVSQYGENYKESSDFKKVYLDLINQYVEHRILVSLAKDENLVDDGEIQKKVDEEFKNMESVFENKEAFETAIVNSRFKDVEDYKNKLKISMIIESLISKEIEGLKISSSDVKDYYEQNKDKFLRGPGADVYHIFINDEETAKKVFDEIKNGGDFAKLAKSYGQDGTASVGGYLGYQEYDNSQLVSEFMKEVKDMKEGEVRGPVKTQFGYHIIKIENVKKEKWTEELERVSSDIEETLKADKINSIMDSLVKRAKEKYKVKIYEDNILGKKE